MKIGDSGTVRRFFQTRGLRQYAFQVGNNYVAQIQSKNLIGPPKYGTGGELYIVANEVAKSAPLHQQQSI